MKEYEDLGYEYVRKEFLDRFHRYMMISFFIGVLVGITGMYFAKPRAPKKK